jgi:hypothetical protein
VTLLICVHAAVLGAQLQLLPLSRLQL